MLPILILSWLVVRYRRQYRFHMWLQSVMGGVLGVVILTFEIEIRLYGWRHLAAPSPYYDDWVLPALVLHLIFAIPALLFWVLTIFGAFKNYGRSPRPSRYSIIHKKTGRLAMVLMGGTGATGWLFYWLAFIA
jgi:uncharacterized membrane protein YozB (DUF420 family)